MATIRGGRFADGEPVQDRGSRFDGLHNYGMRGLGTMVQDESGGWYDDGVTTPYVAPALPADASGYFQIPTSGTGPSYLDTSGAVYSGAAYSAPAQNSAQWANFATSLAKMGFTLAQINAIQPGTVVSANGAILRQNPGYAVGTPTTGTLNLGGLSTSTLLIAALVIGGVFMMSKGGR
jgi:hypothetical protein